MLLRDLNDVRHLLAQAEGTFFGIGVTAFARIAPLYFLKPYPLVALRRTRDLPLLRKKTPVFCLEEATGRRRGENGVDSAALLAHPKVKAYLRSFRGPRHLYVYQNYAGLAARASAEGWRILANPPELRLEMGRRRFFEEMIQSLGLPRIPGEICPIAAIQDRDYRSWARELGESFVVQLPEILQGGGRGTFFVHCESRYRWVCQRLRQGIWRGVPLRTLSVRRFIQGVPASVATCVTRYGTLVSGPQVQLIHPPYCRDLLEDGVFYGHAWHLSHAWTPAAAAEARRQAAAIGDYAARLGYRGLLGIDLVMERDGGRVYPIEINPRFTGVFPMLSLLQIQGRLIPLEALHLIEFLGLPYQIDLEQMNRDYASSPLEGGHVILFSCRGTHARVKAALDAGIYLWQEDRGQGIHVGDGMDYGALEDDAHFAIVDGPPDPEEAQETPSDSLARYCRILFRSAPATPTGGLSEQALRVVEWVYARLGIPG
jgi:hypothetical protein